jgi:hypothetical protein
MGLLKRLFSGKRSATPAEHKQTADAAPRRTMVTVLTLASTEPEPVKAPSPLPARDPVVSKPTAAESNVIPPKESAQELLERIRTRNERHNDLKVLVKIERSLPLAMQTQKMAELQTAVFNAIETDVKVREYRQAYYLYQSALHVAQRS